jgi:hypothetical protein
MNDAEVPVPPDSPLPGSEAAGVSGTHKLDMLHSMPNFDLGLLHPYTGLGINPPLVPTSTSSNFIRLQAVFPIAN